MAVDWPSGYGPPPEPPPRDYTSGSMKCPMGGANDDNRMRMRMEACRSGLQELDALRAKHSLMMQSLRSRLPVIPGGIEEIQTREKKPKNEFLDRFSMQSVDSGVSSAGQNTISSTRCSSPATSVDDYASIVKDTKNNNRLSNLYDTPSTMNYSTFRKISLQSNDSTTAAPITTTSRSCHRGAWKTPQRPKSMYDSSSSQQEFLFEKPPRAPIDLNKQRRSAFIPVTSSKKTPVEHLSMSNLSLGPPPSADQSPNQRRLRTVQKPDMARGPNKIEKADTMFRANYVYVASTSPEQVRPATRRLRFSPSRSPPMRKAVPLSRPSNTQATQTTNAEAHAAYATPCKIRSSPKMTWRNNTSTQTNSQNHHFASKPAQVPVRSSNPSRIAPQSTWLQSQNL